MGAFLDKPKTEKLYDSGSAAHGTLRYGLSSMQGWRIEMEDAHVARTSLPPPFDDAAFFAVFDGHAGCRIAKHSAACLLEDILRTKEFQTLEVEINRQKLDLEEMKQSPNQYPNKLTLQAKHIDMIVQGIKLGFLSFDEKMRSSPLLYGENERSGTTAVCALICPSHIFLANLGDSRAIMSRAGAVCIATEDHKPYVTKERERIIRAGGSVMIQRVNGSLAVSRALGDFDYKNVPGLGPCEQLVSPEPDIYVIERDVPSTVTVCSSTQQISPQKLSDVTSSSFNSVEQGGADHSSPAGSGTALETTTPPTIASPTLESNVCAAQQKKSASPNKTQQPCETVSSPNHTTSSSPSQATSGGDAAAVNGTAATVLTCDPNTTGAVRDEFLILACDGIFDVMTNQELCDFVRSRLTVTNRLDFVCNQILDSCLSKGSKDNMSVVLVTFPGAPQVSTDAVARDEDIQFLIIERIKEFFNIRENALDIDMDYLLRALKNQEIPGLPPDAGIQIHAMRSLVESTLENIRRTTAARVHGQSPPVSNASLVSPVAVTTSPAAASSTLVSSSPVSPPPTSVVSRDPLPIISEMDDGSPASSMPTSSPAAKKFSKSPAAF